MSFNFNGTSSTLDLGSALVTGPPLTLAARYNPTSLSNNQTLVGVSSSTSVAGDHIVLEQLNLTGAVRARSTVAGTGVSASLGGFSARTGRWTAHVGIFTSSTSRIGVGDPGTSGVVSATASTPTGIDRTNVSGRYTNGAVVQWTNGLLADVAIWNCDLSVPEAQAYCTGVSPLDIRPSSLVLFLPLDRDIYDRSKFGNILVNTAAVANSWVPPTALRPPLPAYGRKFYMANSVAAPSGLIINPMIGPVDMQRFAA